METIAVYFEPKVRTYGFNHKENLVLFELTIQSDLMAKWGRALQALGDLPGNFHLVWACPDQCGAIKFMLLCDDVFGDQVSEFIQGQKDLEGAGKVLYQRSLDLIYFQGPHFGDRHGIADFTLKALAEEAVPITAMTCSGAAVYLVIQNTWAVKALKLLTNAFEIPSK